MPEIKRTFTAGKMNKDLDERLVRNGEYRDALNIQVRTTDGGDDASGIGDAGTVQNVKGNNDFKPEIYKTIGYNYDVDEKDENNTNITRILGSVADEKNDKAYFFATAPWPIKTTQGQNVPISDMRYLSWETIRDNQIPVSEYPDDETLENMGIEPDDYDPHDNYQHAVIQGPSPKIWIDSIIEVDTKTSLTTPIFIDKYAITGRMIDIGSSNFGVGVDTDFTQITVGNGSLYRVGMIAYLRDNSGNHLLFRNGINSTDGFGVEIVDIQDNLLTLATQQSAVNLMDLAFEGDAWKLTWIFAAERVLEFDYWKTITKGNIKLNLIPNINIIDDLLFWTDGVNEPKKINITRSKRGTSNFGSNPQHTKLYVSDPSDETATYPDDLVDVRTLEPSLLVEGGDVLKENITVIREAPKSPPSLLMKNTDRDTEIDFIVDYSFTNELLTPAIPSVGTLRTIIDDVFLGIDIRVGDVLNFRNTFYDANPITITAVVTEVDDNAVTVRISVIDIDYENVTLEQSLWEVTIEQKRALFETKFGRVAYRYKYEDGEYSTYSPWSELAFLPGSFSYTPSQGYNNGMENQLRYLVIKDFIPDTSIRPNDVQSIDILWKTTDDQNVYIIKTITREIDSEWEDFSDPNIIEGELENTGVLVVTSEMIHKVLPTNQLFRGYDNVPKTAVTQEITANRLVYGNYTQGYDIKRIVGLKQQVVSEPVYFPVPEKSVKSIRSYKFGMVFGDKYGRETPVISSGYQVVEGETITGDIGVEKSLAHFSNKFNVQQQWGATGNSSPLHWIDYVKYYVKETSNEYYNLVLDRWYDAGDGNVWLAFPSVDRNKVDEETYLILKNEHGNHNPVTSQARYKILAIENEAPDFIKTDHRPMGRIEIDRKGVYGVNGDVSVSDGIPDGLISEIKIRTSSDHWSGYNEGGMLTNTDFDGVKKVRIVGTFVPDGGDVNQPIEAFSPWRTVSRIKATGNRRGCDIQEIWKATEVDMHQKIIAILSDPSQINVELVDDEDEAADGTGDRIIYWMEFKDEVVENKPEFDGRFFVKILRDEILSQSVLNIAAGTGNYQVQDVYEIGLIANWDANPGLPNENDSFVPNTPGPYGDGAEGDTGNGWPWPTDADGEEVAGFNEANIDSWPLDINGDAVPNFGISDTDSTKLFWEWWAEQVEEDKAASVFIDMVPCYSNYVYFQELDYMDLPDTAPDTLTGDLTGLILQWYGSGTEPLNIVGDGKNYQPAGLSPGRCTEPNNYGQLTLSTSNETGLGFNPGKDSIFKAKMQEVGTLFRFQNDPNQTVYRVIPMTQNVPGVNVTYSYLAYESGYNSPELAQEYVDSSPTAYNYQLNYGGLNNTVVQTIYYHETTVWTPRADIEGPISINGAINFPLGEEETSNPIQKRHSIITRFAKVDDDGGSDTARGVDITLWDPRNEVKHTGIGKLVIEILDEVGLGELQVDTVATDSACWETEPKENIDVDIYYEASRGIPMYLTKNNINEYVDPSYSRNNACLFDLDKRVLTTGDIETEEFSGNPWIWKTMGDDVILVATNNEQYPDEFETKVLTQTNAKGISIGDIVAFKHIGYHSSNNKRFGLVTRSKILDHVKPIIYGLADDNIVDVPVPSTRYLGVIGDGYNTEENGAPSYFIEFSWSTWTNSGLAAGLQVGMEVTGNNIEFGTFVTAIETLPGEEATVYISKPLLAKGIGRFNFIQVTGYFRLEREVWRYDVDLGWFNCYSFGNAVESDRIRDDFNAPTIDNGVRVSSTFLEYKEEHLGSNLIHSSEIFNSTSGINGLNQFNMAEKITKSLNPIYGSIQRLKTRDTDLVTFCEDKVLKVLASKDALYNADGNAQLTATNRVLGTAVPFAGDYGISKNPESMATDTYRLYFTDKQRGAVLRLSRDGLTPISNVSMKTYFRETLPKCENIIGTYDIVNGEYNVTLSINEVNQGETVCTPAGCTVAAEPQTVTFNEGGKAWVSFKSFVHACGVSVTGKYFTAPLPYHRGDKTADADNEGPKDNQLYSPLNKIWLHHSTAVSRNSFYGNNTFNSEIEVVFNDMPDTIKSFRAINYEGSKANIEQFTETTGYDVEGNELTNINDGNYYNLTGQSGWKVQSFNTDLQTGFVPEFIQKENKWFNFIHGSVTTTNDLLSTNLTKKVPWLHVQGIGFPLEDPTDTQIGANIEMTASDQNGNPTTDAEAPVGQPPIFSPPALLSMYNNWNTFQPDGGPYGTMYAVVQGGTYPYSFTVQGPNGYNNSGTGSDNFNVQGNQILDQQSFTIPGAVLTNADGSGYGPGEYIVTATDANGDQTSITINFNSVTYPPPS